MRARRRVRQPPDLTSLFDVLFIVVFAALIRAAAVENAAAHPTPKPTPPAPETPPAIAALRQRALADLSAELAALTPLVVRIGRGGAIESLEVEGRRIALVEPLLEHSADREAGLVYAGRLNAERQVCRIAAQRLGTREPSRYLVIMVPATSPRLLPQALLHGLRSDVDNCQYEQRWLAVLVDPTTLAPPTTPSPAAPPASPAPPASQSAPTQMPPPTTPPGAAP